MEETKAVVIGYAIGFATANEMTTDAESIVKLIQSHSSIQVTEQEVEEVIQALMTTEVVRKAEVSPYA